MTDTLTNIWSGLEPIQGEVYGVAFSLLTALIIYIFRAKVNLIYGKATNSHNLIKVLAPSEESTGRNIEIYTEKFFVQNTGRKPASNVEFVLSSAPTSISVWEPRDVQYKTLDKGECLVQIPNLAPTEMVAIDCVYIDQKAAVVMSVKCVEAVGKVVPFWTLRRFPSSIYWLIWVLIILGVAFVFQTLFAIFGGAS